MQELVDNLRSKVSRISVGGDERSIKRHTSKGKLMVRDRISRLLDPSSPFLELSQMCAYELYGSEEVPAGGIITGTVHVRR